MKGECEMGELSQRKKNKGLTVDTGEPLGSRWSVFALEARGRRAGSHYLKLHEWAALRLDLRPRSQSPALFFLPTLEKSSAIEESRPARQMKREAAAAATTTTSDQI